MILLDVASHPVGYHVKGFGVFLAHIAGDDAVGGRAVSLDRGGRLWVDHFDEDCADGNSLLSVEENRFSFGFRGRSHDSADSFTFCEYQTIRGWSGDDVG